VDKGSTTTRYFSEQIRIFEEEGADLLLLEMLLESESALCLLDACAGSRLPVWAGLSASRSVSTDQLIGFRRPGSYGEMNEERFESLCATVVESQPDAIGVMHTKSELLSEAIESLLSVHTGPTFAYPNVGYFQKPTWVFPDDIEVEKLCDDLVILANRHSLGAVGGCCGTTPSFIKRLNNALHDAVDRN